MLRNEDDKCHLHFLSMDRLSKSVPTTSAPALAMDKFVVDIDAVLDEFEQLESRSHPSEHIKADLYPSSVASVTSPAGDASWSGTPELCNGCDSGPTNGTSSGNQLIKPVDRPSEVAKSWHDPIVESSIVSTSNGSFSLTTPKLWEAEQTVTQSLPAEKDKCVGQKTTTVTVSQDSGAPPTKPPCQEMSVSERLVAQDMEEHRPMGHEQHKDTTQEPVAEVKPIEVESTQRPPTPEDHQHDVATPARTLASVNDVTPVSSSTPSPTISKRQILKMQSNFNSSESRLSDERCETRYSVFLVHRLPREITMPRSTYS
ncbi:hypothetical protein BIW11_04194 [Tropilaelaps mercedesae]|uniref:Uncharacterized protein n=1 Tax=Tropilaelaps mercedesae TaxID=418985 RepID=A0A1V9XA34_9ACAR|nr:hypothetical protein BIW11_04194 [Tropilaelaps mercedesae]